jgi:hypothetical protein
VKTRQIIRKREFAEDWLAEYIREIKNLGYTAKHISHMGFCVTPEWYTEDIKVHKPED